MRLWRIISKGGVFWEAKLRFIFFFLYFMYTAEGIKPYKAVCV